MGDRIAERRSAPEYAEPRGPIMGKMTHGAGNISPRQHRDMLPGGATHTARAQYSIPVAGGRTPRGMPPAAEEYRGRSRSPEPVEYYGGVEHYEQPPPRQMYDQYEQPPPPELTYEVTKT